MGSSSARLLATARRELQLNTRGTTFWSITGVGALYALWRGTTPEATAALASYQIVQLAVGLLGVVAVLLGGAAAGRDARERSQEMVLTKPMGSSPALVIARFVGVWLSLLATVLAMLVVVFLSQLITRGTPWNLVAYGNAFLRVLAPLGLAVALGFALATLFNALAAGLAALCWVCVPLARTHVPAVLDLTVAQHWFIAVALTFALVALSMARHGAALVKDVPGRRTAGWVAAACFAVGALAALAVLFDGTDAIMMNPDKVLAAMSHQTAIKGEQAPGFWLTTADHRLIALSDYAGRPVVLLFWGPSDPVSFWQVRTLQKTLRRHAADKVTGIAICIDKDAGAMAPFTHEVDSGLVMAWDRGRHFNPGQLWLDSPLCTAYSVEQEQTPAVFIVSPERLLVSDTRGSSGNDVETAVTQYLKGR